MAFLFFASSLFSETKKDEVYKSQVSPLLNNYYILKFIVNNKLIFIASMLQ